MRVHEGTFTNSHDHHCHTLGLPFRTAETYPTNGSNAVTVYENLARDGTITDPTVILRWRDREFGYRPEGIDRWIWDRVELEGGLWPFLDALLARLGLVEEEEREVWILEHAEDDFDLRRANSRTPDVRTVHRMTDRGDTAISAIGWTT